MEWGGGLMVGDFLDPESQYSKSKHTSRASALVVSSGTAIKVVWFPLRGDKTRIDFCYCNGSLKLGPFVSKGDFESLFWDILTFKLRKPFEKFQKQTRWNIVLINY